MADKVQYQKVEENGKGVYCRFYKNDKAGQDRQPIGSVFFMINGVKYRAGLWKEEPDENGETRCDYSGRVEMKVEQQSSSSSQKSAPSTISDSDIPF